MNKNMTVVFVLMLTAGCTSSRQYDATYAPPMDSSRKVAEQDCAGPVHNDGGNLMCRQISEDERRARIAEEERQARERKEAQERAAREQTERERAEQLAKEEAARKQQAAEQERLAAEAARKAEEERARLAKVEADARAAREAAERECRRIAQEQLDGRAVLTNFVTNYGKVGEFKGMAGQITTFLDKAPKTKPCPPA
jgi:hypothetical protein